MKGRIIGSLSEFAKDEPIKRQKNLCRIWRSKQDCHWLQSKDKSKAIIQHIIHNYAAFDISTIEGLRTKLSVLLRTTQFR